jgi:hypothetical protein
MKTFNSSDFEQKPLNRSKAYILLRDEAVRLPFPHFLMQTNHEGKGFKKAKKG